MTPNGAHCFLSCLMAKLGGSSASFRVGLRREAKQQKKKERPLEDSASDMVYNMIGIICAEESGGAAKNAPAAAEQCWECCFGRRYDGPTAPWSYPTHLGIYWKPQPAVDVSPRPSPTPTPTPTPTPRPTPTPTVPAPPRARPWGDPYVHARLAEALFDHHNRWHPQREPLTPEERARRDDIMRRGKYK